MKDKNNNKNSSEGLVDCKNCVGCSNSAYCDSSAYCDNSVWCNCSVCCNNSAYCCSSAHCNNSAGCYCSVYCDGSINCDCSAYCDGCAYCFYCYGLVLEKFMIFNKPVKTKEEYDKIKNEIHARLGYSTQPNELTEEDIEWLKENVKQFDKEVLGKIIKANNEVEEFKKGSDKQKRVTK